MYPGTIKSASVESEQADDNTYDLGNDFAPSGDLDVKVEEHPVTRDMVISKMASTTDQISCIVSQVEQEYSDSLIHIED